MVNWIPILIYLAAWIVPGIWIFKANRWALLYCLLVFGGFAASALIFFNSPLWIFFWAMFAAIGLIFSFSLNGWWRLIGSVSTMLTAWALIQYTFTGTIFWF